MTKWISEYIRTEKKPQIWIQKIFLDHLFFLTLIFKYGKMGQNNEMGPNKYPRLFAQEITEWISECIRMLNNDWTNIWISMVQGKATFTNMNNTCRPFN